MKVGKFSPFIKTDYLGKIRCFQAYTLMEVLVVLAVILLLSVLLFGVTGKIKKSSNIVKCAQNLRNIAKATIQYTIDQNGTMPSRVMHNSYLDFSYPGIKEYLPLPNIQPDNSNSSIISCPEVQSGPNHSNLKSEYFRTYSYNHDVCSNSSENIVMKLHAIESPSRTLLAMDGLLDASYSPLRYQNSAREVWLYQLKTPHDQKVNVVFVDGHVELLEEDMLKEPHILWRRIK